MPVARANWANINAINVFTKFRVIATEAPRVRRFLSEMGYSAARLFLGYGGVADALSDRQNLRF